MTVSSKKKRLDAVEIALTPKEWAIRLADEARSHPSRADFLDANAKGTLDESPVYRPFKALIKQAEERHPGRTPEAEDAQIKLNHALANDFTWRKQLWADVNEAVRMKTEVAALKAAPKLSRLQTIVLQDAFGRTARKAAEWVQGYKTFDAAEEESRQGMMEELAAYADVDFGEKWADSIPLPGGMRIRFPSVIEDWITEVVVLAGSVFAHRAAVQVIQDKHFDGHPLLFLDVEAGLDDTIKTLEDGMATFNAYLKTRAELFTGEWEVDEEENDGVASAIPGEREGRLIIDIDAIRAHAKRVETENIAAQWVKAAKNGAKQDYLSRTDQHGYVAFLWQSFREARAGKS